MATVYQAVRNGCWSLPRGRHPITVLLKTVLPIPVLIPTRPYLFKWRNSLNGTPSVFSASKTWSALHPVGHVVPWKKSVWFSQHIPKHGFIHWVVTWDRLPTRDRLRRWGLQVPDTCLLCNVAVESHTHLFFDCMYASQVWESFFTHPRLNPPIDFDHIVYWVRTASSITKLNIICKLLLQTTINELWKERNARLHRDETKTQLIREVQGIMRRKLASLDTGVSPSIHPSSNSSSAQSYLSLWFGYF